MFDDTFDFHNLGLLEPNQIKYYCETFIKDSFDQGNNYLLIITGKGIAKGQSSGLVKKTVLMTLKQNKYIRKFKEAKTAFGGSGAFEIWLKA